MNVKRRSSFFILTNAPATGAPEASLTTPCKTPERSCAFTGEAANHNPRTALKKINQREVSMNFLLTKKKGPSRWARAFLPVSLAACRLGVALERLELEHRGAVIAADPERHRRRRVVDEQPAHVRFAR